MMIYKKIARASDDRALEETAREIADRFGEPPEPVRRLVAYSRLRARAERLRVTSITRQAGQVHLRFAEDAAVDPERLLDFVRRTRGAKLSPAGCFRSRPPPETPCSELMSARRVRAEEPREGGERVREQVVRMLGQGQSGEGPDNCT
jgi:transcription-repair coupling factor (superfamily II helicase)